jgi:pyruvate kinase
MKKTKIVCTIGPSSEQKDQLKSLIEAGMNVMRMNFSHGSYEEQGARVKNVKELNKENGWNVGIMLDTKGPEIRTGYLVGSTDENGELDWHKNPFIMLEAGKEIRVTMDYNFIEGSPEKIAVSYAGLYDDLKEGDFILIEDGLLRLKVTGKDAATKELICRVENSRKLKNKKNINVPGVKLNMEFISEKDRKDLEWGCDQGVDFVSASFVRRASDIQDIRDIFASKNDKYCKIISKIENTEGVENMEEIVALSDGVMVARGDMGVNVDAWDVPAIQRQMIYLAQSSGKIVVTATQMLDSMQGNPRPTRAEVSDVYDAVLEGTGATMLSGESAQGDFPLEAVTYMAKIDERAEQDIDHDKMIENVLENPADKDEKDAIGLAVATVAKEFEVSAVVAEGDYELGMKISQFRPASDVFMAVEDEATARSLAFAWGVQPVVGKYADALKAAEEKLALEKGAAILKVTAKGIEFTTTK